MRVHYLQHVPFERLGSIEEWLLEKGCETTHTRFYASEMLPDIETIDMLIILGGPMSIHDEAQFPWLAEEKQFVRQAVKSGKVVLGICLGAQLIAAALGARVYPNPEKEIGWFPVRSVSTAQPGVFRFPPELTAFHWHGETFELPPNAVHLAQSATCTHQAFQVGNTVMGLQFHLETTPKSVSDIIENCREELAPSPYIQTEAAMLADAPVNCTHINPIMKQVLEFMTQTAH